MSGNSPRMSIVVLRANVRPLCSPGELRQRQVRKGWLSSQEHFGTETAELKLFHQGAFHSRTTHSAGWGAFFLLWSPPTSAGSSNCQKTPAIIYVLSLITSRPPEIVAESIRSQFTKTLHSKTAWLAAAWVQATLRKRRTQSTAH